MSPKCIQGGVLMPDDGTVADQRCTVGSGFDDACQQAAKYAATWTDNGDEGLLCEEHAATARSLPNGPSLHLRSLLTGAEGDR